jgi:beta-galactosidase
MEHSTSAVNWQPRNIAKRPGEMRRNSLAHVARGADAVLFFQWRAAAAGAEKFHSTMLPRGGTDSRQWRDVTRLGTELAALRDVRGSRVVADAAVVWDYESWWALELEWRPSCDLRYLERVAAHYERLWRAHLTVDFVHPEADLAGYRLVVVPSLYLTTAAAAANLAAHVRGGGTLLVSCFSGIADAHDAFPPGRHPGALREVLGLEIEELLPLRQGETVRLEGGCRGDVWAEDVLPRGAEAVLRYLDGPAAGGPAVTRHRLGKGAAWYVSTRLAGDDLGRVLDQACADAGLAARADLPAGLEVVRRDGAGASYLFLINHGEEDAEVPASGVDALTGAQCEGRACVPAGTVRVIVS